jgi:hypothetical protein
MNYFYNQFIIPFFAVLHKGMGQRGTRSSGMGPEHGWIRWERGFEPSALSLERNRPWGALAYRHSQYKDNQLHAAFRGEAAK